MKCFWRWLKLPLAVYSVGLMAHCLFRILELSRRLIVKREFRLPILGRRPLLVVANHPSLLEPFLLVAMFGRQYLYRPVLMPWSTPDAKNFGHWCWGWLRPRAIMVPRGNGVGEREVLRRMKEVLTDNGTVVLFPEGGRTSSSTGPWLTSRTGDKLRPLKSSVGLLVRQTRTRVLPVWVAGTDLVMPNRSDQLFHTWPDFRRGPITIRVGRLLEFDLELTRDEITTRVAEALLELAAQGHQPTG